MKKKGFTLIELLAVIVILAIIALIATPLVLKYIETARTNSKITSTHNYMKAVENALASYSITNKGKSYPEGCYEISTLNIDLDISMKGNMPSEGKVCIEDNKIKKSIVKYPDNKIIKYENDKSTVSDEETYESFNSVSDYIIDVDVEFAYDEQAGGYTAPLTMDSDITNKFEEGLDYDLVIDNNVIVTISGDKYYSDFVFYSYVTDASKLKGFMVSADKIEAYSVEEITGVHNIKIGNPRPSAERIFFFISENGYMSILSYDFIEGPANILIKNEEGTEYYNNVTEIEQVRRDGKIGVSNFCNSKLPELPNIYSDLIDGKTITIEVTQTINGKEIKSSISKKLDSMYGAGANGVYFSSSHPLSYISIGC